MVAALANALVPAVFFSETHFFGQTAPRERALVAAVVLPSFIEALRSWYMELLRLASTSGLRGSKRLQSNTVGGATPFLLRDLDCGITNSIHSIQAPSELQEPRLSRFKSSVKEV